MNPKLPAAVKLSQLSAALEMLGITAGTVTAIEFDFLGPMKVTLLVKDSHGDVIQQGNGLLHTTVEIPIERDVS
ncbi:hypothetical protein GCM10027169_13010 [Gordonia jinhuaensis]|uniref:Uncharacterized protein n=1 Tax=Gordonia jinhuaensis TaxID=1517702 RepID=A0A916WRA5_9ACTN|nr:hypothetical protein [Gordonia jinhuaensis]GGB22486.1 hypothetical protein GCM10011489_08350 [Gordonia jinhuaensis]